MEKCVNFVSNENRPGNRSEKATAQIPESGFINWLYAVSPWGGILRNAVHRNGS